MFFLIATAVYGSLHAYLWWKVVRQLELRWPAALALAICAAALVLAPFLGRRLRDGSPLFASVELAMFVWMGAAFYLFLLNVGADLWNLGVAAAGLVAPGARAAAIGGPRLFWGIAVATALIVGWAALEAANVRVRTFAVPTAKLAPGSAPVRVVQVSDVHVGLLLGPRRLDGILRRVREARPDLLVCTGDMLDAVGDHLEPLAAMWRQVAPPLGKFAVTGNHEYYAGMPGSVAFLESAGFRVLRDETAVLPGVANLVGRDYVAPERRRPLAALVGDGDPALFTLLLKHLPTGFEQEAAPAGVDLQLSGHTHDGQLFPFRLLVRLSFRHLAGHARERGSLLYVSRGTGTWGPPLRLLAPPEVTVHELVPAATPAADRGAPRSARGIVGAVAPGGQPPRATRETNDQR